MRIGYVLNAISLGITFESTCKQPSHIVGRSVRDYEPSKTEFIIGDGNCLFRYLSKIIPGSEGSHLQLRCIISRFIASEGTTKLGWHFISKQTALCEYLLVENLIYRESIWGSDVEIMDASALLAAVIYVAKNDYRKPGQSLLRSIGSCSE